MSNLREAAQQALDWLYGNDILHPTKVLKVLQDLRAALEQDESEGSVCIRCGALAFDPLVPQQAEPEPVEEQVTYSTGGLWLDAGFYAADELRGMCKALDSMNAAARGAMRRSDE